LCDFAHNDRFRWARQLESVAFKTHNARASPIPSQGGIWIMKELIPTRPTGTRGNGASGFGLNEGRNSMVRPVKVRNVLPGPSVPQLLLMASI
jgi:hypothetical protein